MAPRHPPNALLSLVNTAARTQYQHARDLPKRTIPRVQPSNGSLPTLGTPATCPQDSTKKAPHPASTQQRYRSHLTIFSFERTRETAPGRSHPEPVRLCLSKTTRQGQEQDNARSTTRPQPLTYPMAWRRSVSNRRPPACKAGALPLSYAPTSQPGTGSNPSPQPFGPSRAPSPDQLVGQGGLEPPTPRLSSVCSNQLSYWPKAERPPQTVKRKDARPEP